MNTKTILLSAAVILAITPASAQLRPDWGAIDRVMRDNPPAPQPVPRSQLPNGSTGNGCLGYGRGVVAMVNQIADSLNVEGSELTSPQVARDAVDTTAESQWRQMRQNLIGQHQRSERIPHSIPFVLPPDWDVPYGNFGAAMRRLVDQDYARCFPRAAKLMADTVVRVKAKAKHDHEVRLAEQKARAEEAARKAEADAIRARQEHEARMADQAARAEAASKQLEADNRRAEEAHKQAMIEKARQADEAAKAAAEAKKRFEEEEVLSRKRREAEAEQQGIERKRREAERERQPPVRTPDNNEVKTDAGVSLAGTLANFTQYCPRDFQALTPQYQYAVLTYVQWEVRDHGADAVKQATIARYQDGYYTLGHRWCSIAASTAKSIASAMTR